MLKLPIFVYKVGIINLQCRRNNRFKSIFLLFIFYQGTLTKVTLTSVIHFYCSLKRFEEKGFYINKSFKNRLYISVTKNKLQEKYPLE